MDSDQPHHHHPSDTADAHIWTGTAISRLASIQHGVVSIRQLHAARWSDDQVSYAAKLGRLHRLHRGVYAVGHTALPELALEQAALLACGEGAVLSHPSAAWMWRLIERPAGPVHVTLCGRLIRSRPGIAVHRGDTLAPPDIRTRERLALTSPARTLIDLAAQLDHKQWEAALSEARFRKLIRAGELERALHHGGTRPGSATVHDHLARETGPLLTQSEAERRFLTLVRQAGLPDPRTQVTIEGYRVDAVWPEQRLIVELDGLEGHGHRSAFERDRRKDALLIAKGWRVIRYTWPQLRGQPLHVIAILSAALAR